MYIVYTIVRTIAIHRHKIFIKNSVRFTDVFMYAIKANQEQKGMMNTILNQFFITGGNVMYRNIPEIMTFKECQQLLKVGKNTLLELLHILP